MFPRGGWSTGSDWSDCVANGSLRFGTEQTHVQMIGGMAEVRLSVGSEQERNG